MKIETSTMHMDDIIDVRDIIERIEELESEKEDLTEAVNEAATQAEWPHPWSEAQEKALAIDNPEREQDASNYAAALEALNTWSEENAQELQTLTDIMDDLKGYGGDEQWRGDWYPLTLISESYFTDYAEELVRDCYDLKGLPDFVHVDWEATAREIQIDYSTVEIDGVTYFYR